MSVRQVRRGCVWMRVWSQIVCLVGQDSGEGMLGSVSVCVVTNLSELKSMCVSGKSWVM